MTNLLAFLCTMTIQTGCCHLSTNKNPRLFFFPHQSSVRGLRVADMWILLLFLNIGAIHGKYMPLHLKTCTVFKWSVFKLLNTAWTLIKSLGVLNRYWMHINDRMVRIVFGGFFKLHVERLGYNNKQNIFVH